MFDNIKRYLADDSIFYALLILCVGITSFGLGRWSDALQTAPNDQPAMIIMSDSSPDISQDITTREDDGTGDVPATNEGKFVGSINSDKYHLPYCSGAQRIKDENKVWFESEVDAKAQGYTPAGNCPGL